MKHDFIDQIIEHWQVERPDLDAEPMAITGRILLLARHLERRLNDVLKPYGLMSSGFDVLATLRRNGHPYAMTPSELLQTVMLTSGAMTNRLDRLEQKGFIERRQHPDDRRSLQVKLTAEGLRVINQAVEARFEEAKAIQAPLSQTECETAATLLRKLLSTFED